MTKTGKLFNPVSLIFIFLNICYIPKNYLTLYYLSGKPSCSFLLLLSNHS